MAWEGRAGFQVLQVYHLDEFISLGGEPRDPFIKERLGADVADRSHYDAVFNNERHSVQGYRITNP